MIDLPNKPKCTQVNLVAGGVGRRKRDTTTSLKVTWDPRNKTVSALIPGV